MDNIKITITDDIMDKAYSEGIPVLDMVHKAYANEIKTRREKSEIYSKFRTLDFLLMDAGIRKNSLMKDFNTTGASDFLLPTVIESRIRETVPNTPGLDAIVASTTTVDGLTMQSAYFDLVDDTENRKNIRKGAVSEGADLPLAQIRLGEQALTLSKYGRATQATYEALQYMRIDLFMKVLDSIAADIGGQELDRAIYVLINGDGNKYTDGTPNKVLTDTVPQANFNNEALVDFALNFYDTSGVALDTMLVGKEMYRKLQAMQYDNQLATGVNNRMNFSFPQFNFSDINVIYIKDMPQVNGKDAIIGLNKSQALVKYVAANSQIREMTTNIRNQTKLGTISERSGFALFSPKARRALVIS